MPETVIDVESSTSNANPPNGAPQSHSPAPNNGGYWHGPMAIPPTVVFGAGLIIGGLAVWYISKRLKS